MRPARSPSPPPSAVAHDDPYLGNPYLAAAEEEEGADAAGAVAEEAEAGSEDDFSDDGREFRKRYRLAEQPRGPDQGGPGTWRGKNFRWNRGVFMNRGGASA